MLFRTIVTLALTVHVFYMYSRARVWSGEFGAGIGLMFIAVVFALFMLLPLVWLVLISDRVETYARNFRARRRWRKNQCQRCAYDLRGVDDQACPECGRARATTRPEYTVTAAVWPRLIIMNALAWVIGCTAGEALIRLDERMFLSEARAAEAAHSGAAPFEYRRTRWFPNQSVEMHWTEGVGVVTLEDL